MIDRLRSWFRRRRRPRSPGNRSTEREDDGEVWDHIPNRQYGGRFVEGGGNTRAEQEAAIEDVAERADGLDEVDER